MGAAHSCREWVDTLKRVMLLANRTRALKRRHSISGVDFLDQHGPQPLVVSIVPSVIASRARSTEGGADVKAEAGQDAAPGLSSGDMSITTAERVLWRNVSWLKVIRVPPLLPGELNRNPVCELPQEVVLTSTVFRSPPPQQPHLPVTSLRPATANHHEPRRRGHCDR